MEVPPDGFGGFGRDDGGEGFSGGLLHIAQAAEVGKQALAGLRADAGNAQKLRVAVAHGATLAVITDGEAMAFVADQLDEMEHGAAAIEDDGLVFAAVDVDDFFLLCDGSQRLRRKTQRLDGFGSGVELAETAVDEDERGHC